MALDKNQIAEMYFKSTGYNIASSNVLMVTAFARAIEDHVNAKMPPIHAVFECGMPGQLTGQTNAPIKRIVNNDDGSVTVVIDAWPYE